MLDFLIAIGDLAEFFAPPARPDHQGVIAFAARWAMLIAGRLTFLTGLLAAAVALCFCLFGMFFAAAWLALGAAIAIGVGFLLKRIAR